MSQNVKTTASLFSVVIAAGVIWLPMNAFAQCRIIADDMRALDAEMGSVLERYSLFSKMMASSSDRSKHYDDAIRHTNNVISVFTRTIDAIDRGFVERCYGRRENDYQNTKQILITRRAQFNAELQALKEHEKTIRSDVGNRTTGGQASGNYFTQKLNEYVSDTRKKLPIALDERTVLTGIELNGKQLVYIQKVQLNVRILPADLQAKFERDLRGRGYKAVCEDTYLSSLIGSGFSFQYRVSDINNALLYQINIGPKECTEFTIRR